MGRLYHAISKRRSDSVRRAEERIRKGTLQMRHVARIERFQSIVMMMAAVFDALCWLVVLPLTEEIPYAWPFHMLCIITWSSNGDLDYDEFFVKRQVLTFNLFAGIAIAIALFVFFFDELLPCVDNDDVRTILAIFAWLPAFSHAACAAMRTGASLWLPSLTNTKFTTFMIPITLAIMYSWLVNSISILYFCFADLVVHGIKITFVAMFTLGGTIVATSDHDNGTSTTLTFFKLLHLWTASVGVGFIAEGFAPTDIAYENVSKAYLICLGVITLVIVGLIRLYPNRVYGVITGIIRDRVKNTAALAMRKAYQGGQWTELNESESSYVHRGRHRLCSVEVTKEGSVTAVNKDAMDADFFVVCDGVSNKSAASQAVLGVLSRHSTEFFQVSGRLPTYWIWDVCTNSMADIELMPIFASRCERAFVVMSRDLLNSSMGLIQLFTAFLVHCEPERALLDVTGDIPSPFSASLDRAVEMLTKTHVEELMEPGGYKEAGDADWWANWEVASRGNHLNEAKMLVRIVKSYLSASDFSMDLRGRMVAMVQMWRGQKLAASRHVGPHDFSEILSTLADSNIMKDMDMEDLPVEISRRDIEIGRKLGEGQFGEVWQATFVHRVHLSGETSRPRTHSIGTEIQVAVKTLIESDSAEVRHEFLREAAINWSFRHSNVVEMFGVVTDGYPLLLVLELCHHGGLKDYLEKEDSDHSAERLFRIMRGIASGMAYLASKNFVHRDLAARNVLLNRRLDAKVADFGMGRDLKQGDEYQATGKHLLLPIRWTDPDVVVSTTFSEYTDVWAYGVTAIEIWTGGVTPYRGWTTSYMLEALQQGYRLPRPETCSPALYDAAIAPCWFPMPDVGSPRTSHRRRPSFGELVDRLGRLEPLFCTEEDVRHASKASPSAAQAGPAADSPRNNISLSVPGSSSVPRKSGYESAEELEKRRSAWTMYEYHQHASIADVFRLSQQVGEANPAASPHGQPRASRQSSPSKDYVTTVRDSVAVDEEQPEASNAEGERRRVQFTSQAPECHITVSTDTMKDRVEIGIPSTEGEAAAAAAVAPPVADTIDMSPRNTRGSSISGGTAAPEWECGPETRPFLRKSSGDQRGVSIDARSSSGADSLLDDATTAAVAAAAAARDGAAIEDEAELVAEVNDRAVDEAGGRRGSEQSEPSQARPTFYSLISQI
mmetsp:Transcript_20384/g.52957  ORF Transcript_20384/g.52957 Transcript_20384/m.52957 type:complete len:1175 (+) Transcript_20384:626-4150(+)